MSSNSTSSSVQLATITGVPLTNVLERFIIPFPSLPGTELVSFKGMKKIETPKAGPWAISSILLHPAHFPRELPALLDRRYPARWLIGRFNGEMRGGAIVLPKALASRLISRRTHVVASTLGYLKLIPDFGGIEEKIRREVAAIASLGTEVRISYIGGLQLSDDRCLPIPKEALELIGSEVCSVVMVGVVDSVEIWRREAWDVLSMQGRSGVNPWKAAPLLSDTQLRKLRGQHIFQSPPESVASRMKNLTARQQILLDEKAAEWIKIAFDSAPLDKLLVDAFIGALYREHGLPEPMIHYAASPREAQHIALELRAAASTWRSLGGAMFQAREDEIYNLPRIKRAIRTLIWGKSKVPSLIRSQVSAALRGTAAEGFEEFGYDYRNAQWCSFYEFCREACFVGYGVGSIDAYCDYVRRSGAFFTIYEASHAIVCPNPSDTRFNNEGQLHSAIGPAVSWDDGFCLHFLNGVPIPETFQRLSPDNQNDLLLLLREKNAAVRRELIRALGVDILTMGLGARTLDTLSTRWGDYELLRVHVPRMDVTLTCLKMLNPSTGAWHIECVPPAGSCREALAWRDGETEYVVPDTLT